MVASVHDGALAPVYVLTAEGREYLAEETGDDAFLYKPIELPHPLQLFHAMAVVEFHITFDAAIATQTAVAVEVWINEGDVINADNPGPAQHYHAPAELCQQLRADADAAFLNQDLAAVHQALAVFQERHHTAFPPSAPQTPHRCLPLCLVAYAEPLPAVEDAAGDALPRLRQQTLLACRRQRLRGRGVLPAVGLRASGAIHAGQRDAQRFAAGQADLVAQKPIAADMAAQGVREQRRSGSVPSAVQVAASEVEDLGAGPFARSH